MKKIILTLVLILSLTLQTQAMALKGGVSKEFIPKGFYGSWGVISKLNNSNNPSLFNYESRDIWTLSGYENKLILENLESGAHSEIIVKEKTKDGKTLKFTREKIVEKGDKKITYQENVSFTLLGNYFIGEDNFTVITNQNGKIKKDYASYTVSGVKISGDNPSN